MRRGLIVLLAVAALAVPAAASATAPGATSVQYWWAEARAERNVEMSYRQPDNAALMEIGEDLRTASLIGDPAMIREAQRRAEEARRGYTVDFATCQGRGQVWKSFFRTFRSKLDMSSASDFKIVFVTVHVVGKWTYRVNRSPKVWNR